MHVNEWLQVADYCQQVCWEYEEVTAQKVVIIKGPFSLFSYPSNSHECGNCLSALKLGQQIVFSVPGKREQERGGMKAAAGSWQEKFLKSGRKDEGSPGNC